MKSLAHSVERLIAAYRKRRPDIKKRLKEFSSLGRATDKEIFRELCFCIFTANSSALSCDQAVKELEKRGLLLNGRVGQIRPILRGKVRFHNKKAAFLVCARSLFRKGKGLDIKDRLNSKDPIAIRQWLVENIKGYGYKEASHFLRNIGLGKDIAILDRHILKNLKRYGVIDNIPDSVGNRKTYLTIEDKMREFSRKVRIPLDGMDLLFWSMETGFIFK